MNLYKTEKNVMALVTDYIIGINTTHLNIY